MWFPIFQKYQIIIGLLISIYLSKIHVAGYELNIKAESDGALFQEKGSISLNTLHAKKKFQCPSMFGAFSDIEDCSKFYLCLAGIPQHLPCPKFKHFDKYRRKCVSVIIAICDKGKGGKETTRSDKEITTSKEKIFLCTQMFGAFPHAVDCSKYYSCSFFLPTLKNCPENQLFDGIKRECRPEAEVNCGSRMRPTSETTITTTPLQPESTPPEVTSTLEVIITPEPTTTSVPTTTLESTTLEPTTTPVPTTTPEPTTTPVPTTIEEQTAPDHNCDEDDLDCIITETGEIPKWFKCPVELGSHRHPSSKKLFIFCINWKPYVKKCGQDLIYSQEVETCVSP